jgi:hypothetical protein
MELTRERGAVANARREMRVAVGFMGIRLLGGGEGHR